MAFNGSGYFARLYSWVTDRDGNIRIRADRMDAEFDGIATGLSNCITKDGQQTVTANIPFNDYKITEIGDATADTDAANRQTVDARIQSRAANWLTSVSGSNTVTAEASPTLTAYEAGQTFTLKPAANNTSSTTINIDSVGAANIYQPDGTPLESGDLVEDQIYTITYDGTDFLLHATIGGTGGGGGDGDEWGDLVDADIIPDADGTRDLGADATRFAETYTDALDVTNNITVGGTVDGRDIASDGTKLDNIETAADVTDAENVDAAGAVMEADYNANTILAANTDDTPAALAVPEQTLVGRITSGSINALSISEVRTLLGLTDEDLQDIAGAMFSGNTETRITASYEDSDGTIDLVVDDDLSNYDNSTSGFLTAVDAGDIAVTSEARGDILFRGASGWERLAAGTSGQFLKTQSTTGDPVWDTIAGGGDMLASNNLSDVASAATARRNLNAASQTEVLNLSLELADLQGGLMGYGNGVRDAFDDETGVSTDDCINQAYDAVNDLYAPDISLGSDILPTMTGATTGGVTIAASSQLNGTYLPWKAANDVVSGSTADNVWHSAMGVAQQLSIDFGTATDVLVYKITSGVSSHASLAPTAFTFEGSNDGSSWTGLDTQSGLSWSAAETKQFILSSLANYQHYRINVTATGGSYVVINEIELSAGSVSNMTLISEDFTADSQPDTARILFQIQPMEAVTPNTDFTISVSRDGGTTYTDATVTEVLSYADGTKIYEDESVDITGQPAGTTMKWRLVTANNKYMKARGVAEQWR